MIIIEIRNEYIRLVEASSRGDRHTIKTMKNKNIPDTYISSDGIDNKQDMKSILEFMLEGVDLKKKVSLVIGGSPVYYQRLEIPKVADKKLNNLVRSTLINQLTLEGDFIVDYSILNTVEKEGKEFYNVIAFGIRRSALESYVEIIDELDLRLVTIDMALNSIVKLFEVSQYNQEGSAILVDVSKNQVRMNMFNDGMYVTSRNLNANFTEDGGLEEYAFNLSVEIDNSIYQLSEFMVEGEIPNIVLYGDGDLALALEESLEEKGFEVEVFKLSNKFTNNSKVKPTYYLHTLGGLIRKDKYFSKNKKFDVNLLSVANIRVSSVERGGMNKFYRNSILLVLAMALGSGFVYFQNWNVEKEIKEIEDYINHPKRVETIRRIDEINERVGASQEIQEDIQMFQDILETYPEYTKNVIEFTVTSAPYRLEVKSISFNEGVVEILATSNSPADFSNFAIKLENGHVYEDVYYEQYSIQAGHSQENSSEGRLEYTKSEDYYEGVIYGVVKKGVLDNEE